jgi:uridine kinase
MIKSELIARKINEKIKVWRKDHAKLVVAIDGYAGSGKTTIADFIAKQNFDVLAVHLDDFIFHWKDRKEMMYKAQDKSQVFEYNWYRYGDLGKLINDFKTRKKGTVKFKTYDYHINDFSSLKSFDLSKKILVIDGIFLLHPKHKISKLWDKTIYLNINFNKADKKRIAREKKRWGKNYIPENHPDNWTRYYKEAYFRYLKKYKVHKKCSLVFKV